MSDVNTASNMVTLKTSDGKELKVSLTVAKQSKTISDAIEDACFSKDPIHLNVTERVLKIVIQYCEQHIKAIDESETVKTKDRISTGQLSPRISDGKLTNWDRQFIDSIDMETLLDLIQACTYLSIQGLLSSACKRVASLIKGKSSIDVVVS